MKIFKRIIISLIVILIIIIPNLLYFFRIDITTTRIIQNYHEVLDKDYDRIDPQLINLVKSIDYGLFINVWRINKRQPYYESTHLFEISLVKYNVPNNIKNYKIENINE